MGIKISKKDVKIMIAQSKKMIEISEVNKEIGKRAIREANIDITASKAIIKYLGGK